MLWAALLPASLPFDDSRRTDALIGLATWCLQFTPRVSLIEASAAEPAVAMEVEASLRLFGGRRKLVERVRDECAELGVRQLSWAPTSLAAVALARAGVSNGVSKPLDQLLDALPLHTLTQIDAHSAMLTPPRLPDPRPGACPAPRRHGAALRCATAGRPRPSLRPATRGTCLGLPAGDLPRQARTDGARGDGAGHAVRRSPAHAADGRLARSQTLRRERLHAQVVPRCDAIHVGRRWRRTHRAHRTAHPRHRAPDRLLAEHLAKVQLLAPVGDLELLAGEVHSLEEKSRSLLPDVQGAGEGLTLALERIAARLGPERVLRPVGLEDHRLEWMCHWQPAPEPQPRRLKRTVDIPQPTFVLPEPLRLATRDHRPLYQGMLQLLAGPHRVEGGWWDRTAENGKDGPRKVSRNVARDYWVALSEHAGVLWIFQTRLADDETAWFLHGTFA